MLSKMAQGQYLQDVFKTLQNAGAIRGTVDDLTYNESTEFSLGCTSSPDIPYCEFQITIKRTEQELVHQLKIAYNNFAQGGIKPQISCDNRRAVFTQLTTPARFTTSRMRRERSCPISRSIKSTSPRVPWA